MNAYELQNYRRRVPSAKTLTQGEAAYYTGIFASRGYDTPNAYNYYRERVKASRTGYLRGLGEEPSWWDRFWSSLPAPTPDAEAPASVDCSGRSVDECIRLIEAARGRVTINEEERSSTAPVKPPNKMNTYLLIGAGIVGLAMVLRAMQR